MTEEDKLFVDSSINSGNQYGYPQCCIDEFVSRPPSELKKSYATDADVLRFEVAHIGKYYTGFIPCSMHAQQIKDKQIKLADLIDYSNRTVELAFPIDWSVK